MVEADAQPLRAWTVADLDALVYPYLDGEFGPDERLEFDEHLGSCSGCAEQVHAETDSAFVRTSFGRRGSQAPAPCRAQAAQPWPLRQEHMRANVRMAQARNRGGRRAVGGRRLRPEASAQRSVRGRRRLCATHEALPMEIKNGRRRKWKRGSAASWTTAFPCRGFPTRRCGRPAVERTGSAGRLHQLRCREPERPTPRRIGLFVFEDAQASRRRQRLPPRARHRRGYNVAIWRDGEIVYQLVADLDEADIRRMVGSTASSLPATAAPALNVQPASLQP